MYSLDNIRVEFEVENHKGEKHQVTHVFRPLGTERYLEYQRELIEVQKRPEDEQGLAWIEAKLKLWADQAMAIEGYESTEVGSPATLRDMAPPRHRIEAVNRAFFFQETRAVEEAVREMAREEEAGTSTGSSATDAPTIDVREEEDART